MSDGPARWAVVVGGSGGLGSAVCSALAEHGWNVAVTYRGNADGAEGAASAVRDRGRLARVVQLDLHDDVASARVVDELAADVGLSGLVYAAGPRIRLDYISKLETHEFSSAIDADVKGCFNVLRPSLRHLRECQGAIVALSTQAATRYAKRDGLSSIPKSAVEAMIRAVAVEEGRYGVRANTVGVGMIEGGGMWDFMHAAGEFSREMLDTALASTPMRRFGSAVDIAHLVRFLLSDDAGWITGQTICVDGGYSAA